MMKNIDINQTEIEQISQKDIYESIIESLLFVSGEPIKLREISNIIECDLGFTKKLIENIMKEYENKKRGIKIVEMEGSYQLVTKQENSEFIQKLLKTNIRQSLSQAALETIAIIAYKQPITRIDIDEIRGVKSDRAISTLVEKKLIKECGRLEVPGRPILYSTTNDFLKYFGLENLKEIPSIEDIVEKFGEN